MRLLLVALLMVSVLVLPHRSYPVRQLHVTPVLIALSNGSASQGVTLRVTAEVHAWRGGRTGGAEGFSLEAVLSQRG